ncbi:hypothetical protein scyTo_0023003, partial [Scyliorhinus torazame]|nr:hypothetical protein [Scyliorhinus torazame]
ENRQRVLLEIKRQAIEDGKKAKRISIASCSHMEKDLSGVDLEFLLLNNYKNSLRPKSLRQGLGSIARSQSLKQIRGSDGNSRQSSSPTQEDVKRLREVSEKVLNFQVGHGNCQQLRKHMAFAQSSRISEESSESVRLSSGSVDGGNSVIVGQEQQKEAETNGAKSEHPASPRKKQQQLPRRHTVSNIPQQHRKNPHTRPESSTETGVPNIPIAHSQLTENSANKSQTHFPEDSLLDLGKQSNEQLANIPDKISLKTLPRPWSHSGEKSLAASTTPAPGEKVSARRKRSITRGFSVEKVLSSPALRKPSISFKAVKPLAAHKTLKEEAKKEESASWRFPNFFNKKPIKPPAGESAAEETQPAPAAPAENTNILANFYKLFSDNKSTKCKNSLSAIPVEQPGTDHGSEAP